MNVPARLAAFLVGLIVLFGASYVVAGAVVPEQLVEDRIRNTEDHTATTTAGVGSHGDDATHPQSAHEEEGP